MKSIAEWQKALRAGAKHKFPKSTWGVSERLESVIRQVDDVKVALSVEDGRAESSHLAHKSANHSIGALVADALILAEERGVDTEAELEKVLTWFNEKVSK